MGASPYVIEYRDAFSFPLGPEDLWSAFERVERFERWWGWLSEFSLEGGALVSGAVLRGVVSPPLPYRMRLRVELEECERPHLIDAAVHGDLEGRAGLLLEPDETGTRAQVSWTIEMMQRPMRVAARMAPRVMRWGHDRVVETTVRGFRRHVVAEGRRARSEPGGHGGGGEGHHAPRQGPQRPLER
ncbi:MAG TPA: SRPBCC family protein [Acidimicrobiales bacterium]|nr:SRPBCC family protein [Acidimicrobiales bacterium]